VHIIWEKLAVRLSPHAVTGFCPPGGTAPAPAARMRPSARGGLEIADLLQDYLNHVQLSVEPLGRGYAWPENGIHAARRMRAMSCAHRNSVRGCRRAAPTRSPLIKAGSTATPRARTALFGRPTTAPV
jgi:dTDP-glucose pyrophosphorylase